MPEQPIRFAIVGLDHDHAYNHVRMLLNAGAELATCYSDKPELLAAFSRVYPHVPVARSMEAVFEDPKIQVIAGSAMPAERAAISIEAMQHGKDVLADKPAVITLEQLADIERVQRETGRIWCLYSNEHYDRRCTLRAGELVAQGAIGRVVQTTGFGPHKTRLATRPAWFFDRGVSGGIIGDVGAHQIEQFLFFTGSRQASVISSQTGNFAHPDYPEFEDYGDVSLEGDGGLGWFRVDWYTPASIDVPGDIRLFVLGTEGYMEMRKYYDPAGRPGQEHLFVVDSKGTHFVDTANVPLTFGSRFLDDVRHRTETAMSQERSFLVTRLATEAQLHARRLRPALVG
ncbi:MAG TPA: Gfo/Idh/MocA family oxidoreductase [Chloroflexota bacterium]